MAVSCRLRETRGNPFIRERFRAENGSRLTGTPRETPTTIGKRGRSGPNRAYRPTSGRARKSLSLARMKSAFVLGLLLAAGVEAADVSEPGARDAIAAATTEPRFLSPWVADVPDSPTVPSPTKFLGHIVGAPGELTRTEKIYAYFRALAAATPRVKVETIGRTEEGREIVLAIVGDEKELARLGALKADMAALADPRKTNEAAM